MMLVPYQARDLGGIALIAHYLRERYGHEIILTNSYGIERKLMELAPDALVIDHLAWDFKARQARMVKSIGAKLINLPTEGMFQSPDPPLELAGAKHGVTALVDKFLVWGPYVERALQSGGVAPDRLHVTGCPRFDFYADKFRALSSTREDFLGALGIKNAAAPAILWCTNTTYFARDHRRIIDRYVKRAGWTTERVQMMLSDETEQFNRHSALVKGLARRHPDWNFIIKVHPAEGIHPYLPLVEGASNLFLAYNSPIREFLIHSDVLLQRNCTTATEAWMLGRPVLDLAMGTYHRQARNQFQVGCQSVFSVDEADEALQAYLAGAEMEPEKRKAQSDFIADFYFRIDGEASSRCADLIHEALSGDAYTDADQQATREAARKMLEDWKRAEDARPINRVKDLLRIPRGKSLRWWKPLFRERGYGAGGYVAEAEITPEMVEPLYRAYRGVLSTPASPPTA
ncbi:MAG: surface carbohydrate biosynthesis protein [Armatimonadota bacterium]